MTARSHARRHPSPFVTALVAVVAFTAGPASESAGVDTAASAIVVVSVDALRADRLSCYGYERPTSPAVDRLAADGVRFAAARTVEPLTAPAMVSAFTGLPPHLHGASRNGLHMQDGLWSAPADLRDHGWRAAGVISNWTLRDKLTHLGGHFDHYHGVFTRKRWFGLLNSEASAEDVTNAALDWLARTVDAEPDQPVLLWVHYVEPHAPYRRHDEFDDRLGLGRSDNSRSDDYDTEVAAVDAEVGRLVARSRELLAPRSPVVVFLADHGESLGEHDYWGHGRNLYWPSLRIPLIISWPGIVAPATVTAQATIVDLAPTLLGLAGVEPAEELPGVDWAPVLLGHEPPPERGLCYQAHKGAVQIRHDSDRARSRGLLEVGRIDGALKEVFDVRDSTVRTFDLAEDPAELRPRRATPTDALMECVGDITGGLGALDRLAARRLDDESVEQLRALGYLE